MSTFNFDLLTSDIRSYLKEHNMTQREFSRRVGIGDGIVHRLLTGSTISPDIENLSKIVSFLGYTLVKYSIDPVAIVYNKNASTLERIRSTIHADTKLNRQTKEGLFELMRIAYTAFAKQ